MSAANRADFGIERHASVPLGIERHASVALGVLEKRSDR